MKRLLLTALVVALVLAAAGTVAPSSGKALAAAGQKAVKLRARASAAREARQLLDAYVPPPGAVRLTGLPKGEHSPRGGAGGIFGKSIKRHRLWLVHLPAKAFVGYFYHRHHGWHAVSYTTGHDCTCRAVSSTEAIYAARGFGGRATGRVLLLAAVKSHRAGWSLLRADVVVVWHLSAAELEYLPAGVHEIDIRGPHGNARVTNRDQVRTIVHWFDRFPLEEAPFLVASCGVGRPNPSVTFLFQGRNGTLARAIVPKDSGECSAASYTIRGHAQAGLLADGVDHRVEKLLGMKLLGVKLLASR